MTSRTLNGFLWMFSSTGTQYILQVFVLMILARLLAPENFGLVSAAILIIQFSEVFYTIGIGPAIVQRLEIEGRHLRAGFTLSVLLGIAIATLLWLLTPLISSFFRIEGLVPVLRVLVFMFPLRSLSFVAEALLQRDLNFRALAAVEILSYTFGYGVTGVVLAFLGYGVWALVIAVLADSALRTILLLVFRPHPKWPKFDLKTFTELLHYGGGITLTAVFSYFARQGDNLVVGRWLGIEALGLYGRAYNLMAAPVNLIGKVFDIVLFPVMSKLQKEPKHLGEIYRRTSAAVALLALPAGTVLYILTPEAVYVLLGPGWEAVIGPFRIFTISIFLRSSQKISASMIRATGAVYQQAGLQAVYAILILLGSWIAQHWGITSVAVATTVAIGLFTFMMTRLSLKITTLHYVDLLAAHIPALLLSLILGLETQLLAAQLREMVSPILTLLITALVVGLTFLSLLRIIPGIILGEDGLYLFNALVRHVTPRFGALTSVKGHID